MSGFYNFNLTNLKNCLIITYMSEGRLSVATGPQSFCRSDFTVKQLSDVCFKMG